LSKSRISPQNRIRPWYQWNSLLRYKVTAINTSAQSPKILFKGLRGVSKCLHHNVFVPSEGDYKWIG